VAAAVAVTEGTVPPAHFTLPGQVKIFAVAPWVVYNENEQALPDVAPLKVNVVSPVKVKLKILPFAKFSVTAPVAVALVTTVS